MKRPEDFSKKQEKYVLFLEKKIADFSSHSTKVNSYHATKVIVDELNSVMKNGIEVPCYDNEGVPTGKTKRIKLISSESLSDKDEKMFERLFKFMDKQPGFIDFMDKLAEQISPEEKEEVNYASEYEEMIANQKEG